jgi:isopenicillin N synthase-like dioxygenase
MAHAAQAPSVTTVDVSPFVDPSAGDSQRLVAGRALVEALHRYGFVKVTGHGITTAEVREALGWIKKLFDLPYDEKMKAPHPPGPFPHRGYSGIGREKVYSQAEILAHADSEDVGKSLRKITDFKVRRGTA